MFKIKTNNNIFVYQAVAFVIIAAFLFIPVSNALNLNEDLVESLTEEEMDEDTKTYIDEISGEISEKRDRISEINQQSEVFKQNISAKQHEAASLKNEVYLLDNQIGLTNLDISRTEQEAEKIKLEIDKLQTEIDYKTDNINGQKEQISELIRLIYQQNQKSYLEVALLNESFSEFFNEIKYLNNLEEGIKDELDTFQVLKHELEVQHEDLSGKRNELDDTKVSLINQKSDLGSQVSFQELLLDQTKSSEAEYQNMLDELMAEAQQTQIEISSLEKRARAKLADENGESYYGEFTGVFAWPVDSRIITCGFHCAGYPYEIWLGPHAGMDIGASQGSSVYAASDGYVAIARKLDWIVSASGYKRPAYNYINIIHNEQISTVYGHLSQVLVTEGDFVTKGQVIGRSGGLPGTAGAGSFSTGAHIHFEVREVNINGIPIPVDPANYLY